MTSCISLSMASFGLNIVIICLLIFITLSPTYAMVDFYQNYNPLWGQNHITFFNQDTEVQLLLDTSSGAGFQSKLQYESGLITMRMKIPNKKTYGVITSFYLISDNQFQGNHDEIDFEFIGTEGKLQTNLFTNDMGGREEVYQLPFDPSEDFHTYQILYSPHHIVWFVDNIPIRSFKNNTMRGINFPSRPMWIEASLWYSNSVIWAGIVDWNKAPFIASYQDFNISGCPYQTGNNCTLSPVLNPWSRPKIDPRQVQLMRNFRKKYMIYNYCWKNGVRYPECSHDHA